MQASGGASARLVVRFSPSIWAEEVRRFTQGSPARVAAERDRRRLERDGLPIAELKRCEAVGSDRTRLENRFKAYVPIGSGPPSQRPFGFVFELGSDDGAGFLSVVAFGERHPRSSGRSVYERAHKRLHGRYPDQERAQPEATGIGTRVRSARRAAGRSRGRGGGGIDR